MLKRYFSKYFGNDKGFTMIEMMVVLIIIAVLIGGGIRFYLGYVERAKVTKAKSEITAMQAALDSYYAEKGSYPAEDDTELVKAGLATDRISVSNTDAPFQYTSDDDDGYKITTREPFNNQLYLIATGERGMSSEPELDTTTN